MKANRGSAAPRGSRLSVERLEARELLAVFQVSGQEQLLLERLNDARANPGAYGASIGVDLSGVAPAQPLALNPQLMQAARAHSQDMNDRQYYDHTTPDGTDPAQRLAAAGYTASSWGESIAAGTIYPGGTEALQGLIIDQGIDDLQHRKQLLAIDAAFQAQNEVGIGIVQNGTGPLTNYYTIDTAQGTDGRPFLTGVVYKDLNGNGHYDIGEGVSGATVTVKNAAAPFSVVATTQAFSSGGYSVQVAPGTYLVEVSGGGLAIPLSHTVTVGVQNLRLNFGQPPQQQAQMADQTAWIETLYQNLLGRTGSPDEVAVYNNAMLNGMRRDAVALRFLTSPEYAMRQTVAWFHQYLNRDPDDASLQHFVSVMSSSNQKNALVEILASKEYYANHGATPEGFVNALYHDVLQRDPVGDEAQPWLDMLASSDRTTVAANFLVSGEYSLNQVSDFYNRLLYRGVDSAGQDLFVKALTQGVDDRSVLATIAVSDEYYATARQVQWLQNLYHDALGRDAGVPELSLWLTRLRQGVHGDAIALAIATSPEALARGLDDAYRQVLGRPVDDAGRATFGPVLAADVSLTDVRATLAGSQEYFDAHGGDNEGFVRGLYRDLLHRGASDDEVSLWLTKLSQGALRGQVARQFLSSDEYRQQLVNGLFEQYLHRAAYANEQQQFVAQLNQGVSEAHLIGGLLDSSEYVMAATS
jgi:uncharacterized protein YkwD